VQKQGTRPPACALRLQDLELASPRLRRDPPVPIAFLAVGALGRRTPTLASHMQPEASGTASSLAQRTTWGSLGPSVDADVRQFWSSSTPVLSLRPSRACAAPGGAEAGRQVAATNGRCVIRTTRVGRRSRRRGGASCTREPTRRPGGGERRTRRRFPRIEGKTRTRREGSRCGQSGSAHRSLLPVPIRSVCL
jgi:hypothetical protein